MRSKQKPNVIYEDDCIFVLSTFYLGNLWMLFGTKRRKLLNNI